MKKGKKAAKILTRQQVLDALAEDPSGSLLADVMESAGLGRRLQPSLEWRKHIPFPAM